MKKVISKIKNSTESLFYYIFAICFLVFPILLLCNRYLVKIPLIILLLPILLIIFIVSISYLKDTRHKKNNISEYIVEDKKLGKIKIAEDSLNNTFTCIEPNVLFDKYNPNTHFKIYYENSKNLYFETLGYIKENQKEIEQNLKYFFLADYEKDYVENGFKISIVNSYTFAELVKYSNNIKEYRLDVEGEEELNKLLSTSKEDDIFINISAECNNIQYSTAYINCRTKKICYCFDVID